MDTAPKKMDASIKLVQSLIDDCIEEDDFNEAFFLFIKLLRGMDNASRDYLFDRYYKLLNCGENF